jgi:hypothetical protein
LTDAHAAPPATIKDLRNFGFTFGGVALFFGAVLLWKGRPLGPWFVGASAVFFVIGGLAPGLLRPAYGPWMKFAEILGYVNTRILLGLFFIFGITPTGLIMRGAGKDPMGRTFKRKGESSYWNKPTPHAEGARHFDRQF